MRLTEVLNAAAAQPASGDLVILDDILLYGPPPYCPHQPAIHRQQGNILVENHYVITLIP